MLKTVLAQDLRLPGNQTEWAPMPFANYADDFMPPFQSPPYRKNMIKTGAMAVSLLFLYEAVPIAVLPQQPFLRFLMITNSSVASCTDIPTQENVKKPSAKHMSFWFRPYNLKSIRFLESSSPSPNTNYLSLLHIQKISQTFTVQFCRK